MFDGMTYLLAQIAAPVAASFLIGSITGWFLRPGRRPVEPGPGIDQTLAASRARIQELETTLVVLRDEKDTELGRLETGAIEAMESTIARSSERVADLESRLAGALAELRGHQDEALTQRRRYEQLQGARRKRDQRIAELGSTADPAH
jgi:chromosome segregation ATPase